LIERHDWAVITYRQCQLVRFSEKVLASERTRGSVTQIKEQTHGQYRCHKEHSP
jgi:hypothetical protein